MDRGNSSDDYLLLDIYSFVLKAGVYSIPEYLGLRYNQPVRLVAALIACIVAVFAIGVGMWALALTLETYIGWPIWLGILVSGTVVGFYSISGGLAAVAITDSLQVCIMFLCGLIIVYLGLEGLGDGTTSPLNSRKSILRTFRPTCLPIMKVTRGQESFLALGLVLSPAYWIGSQAILQRSLGAKSQWDASASMMFAAFAKTLVPLLIVFPGILALVMKADIDYPDMALPWIIKNVLPAGISGLMFVAIIAALQSTIDSGINSTSLMITRDIRHVLLNDDSTENDLKIGRYLTLLILVIAMSIAPFIGELGGIFTFMQTVLSLFQGPMLALLLLGALSKRATPQAGLWTLITGVPVAGIFLLLGMNMLYVAFVTFCYSMIVLWLVSGVTKGLAEDQLDRLTYLTWRR